MVTECSSSIEISLGQRRNARIALELLDYGIAAVVASTYFSFQLQDCAGDFLRLRRQGFLLRREALTGYLALHQPFIEVLQAARQAGLSGSGASASGAAPVCGQAAAAPALFAEACLC